MIAQTRRTQICPNQPRLEGKLALVTGGSRGIGAEIVRGLAKRGAEVVVAARGNPDTISDCARWADETGAKIHFISMDLGSLPSVLASTSAFTAAFPDRKLASLCANAGVSPRRHVRSQMGIETAYATNCLGHQLLIRMLLQQDVLWIGTLTGPFAADGKHAQRFSNGP